jgi:uncharacterized protein YkwD
MNKIRLLLLGFYSLSITACVTTATPQPTQLPAATATLIVAINDQATTPKAWELPKLPTATSTQISIQSTTTSTPTASPIPSIAANSDHEREQILITLINQIRAEHGLPAYQSHPDLMQAARAHSCDIAQHQIISHNSSDGRTLTERLAFSQVPWEWPSENIAAGSDDPAVIVAMWMDEPPEGWHRRNILDQQQTEIGVGYCFTPEDATGNRHYWTADFTRRANKP